MIPSPRGGSLPAAAFITLIAVQGAPAPAQAGQSVAAHEWLERMMRATETLNYDATFVYRNGDLMESMRIIHRFDEGSGERERLISLTGTAREVLRDSRRVTCFLPDDKTVVVARSRKRGLRSSPFFLPEEGFAKNYRLTTGAGERVAGRDTQRVVVEPRDEFRYGYRLSLDRDTGLLLKSELVGDGGAALEQIVYTNLDTPAAIPDRLLEPAVSGQGFRWYRSDEASTPASDAPAGWSVNWLPEGFVLTERQDRDPRAAGREPVEHLVYTDGLAMVSVFIEHLDSVGDRLEGLSKMGAVSAFGRMVDDYQVTVVGEVPTRTVESIGRNVSRR